MKNVGQNFQVAFALYRRSFAQPLKTAHGLWKVREGILLALTDPSGRVGLGEIAPLPDFGSETLESALEFLTSLKGEIEDWRSVPDSLPCCQFAFEMAGNPPPNPQFWGSRAGDLGGSIAGVLNSGSSALRHWQDLYQSETRTFKWKIGVLTLAEELEILNQLCREMPIDAQIRLDANAGLNLEQAQEWLRLCDRWNAQMPDRIEYLEQPLPVHQFDQLLVLSRQYQTPLALDESIVTYDQLETCYEKGWRGIFVVKPAIAGYPSRFRNWLQTHPVQVVFSSVFETEIGWNAGLQLGQELAGDRALGFGTQRYFEDRNLSHLGDLKPIAIPAQNAGETIVQVLAARASKIPVFLTNPHWGKQEYQQLEECLKDYDRDYYPGTIMIPTGGSSGLLKFSAHTWETLQASVQGTQQFWTSIEPSQFPTLNSQFSILHSPLSTLHSLCLLPMYHVSGWMQFMRSHLTGGQFVQWDWKRLESGDWPAIDVSQYFLSLVPTQLQRLLDHAPHCPQLQNFRAILLGGAPAWSDLLDRALHANLPIALTYGMTETASQVTILPPSEFLAGTIAAGRPLPHAHLEILDAEGQACPPNTIGQIKITASSIALNASQPLQPDDLGYWDDRGLLYLVGRSSDKIITGGENVFPAEVEAAIRATGQVQDVCVIGRPDRLWGQCIVALYVPKPHCIAPPKVLAIAPYKHPKDWIACRELPRNAQGKLDRAQIYKLVEKLQAKM